MWSLGAFLVTFASPSDFDPNPVLPQAVKVKIAAAAITVIVKKRLNVCFMLVLLLLWTRYYEREPSTNLKCFNPQAPACDELPIITGPPIE